MSHWTKKDQWSFYKYKNSDRLLLIKTSLIKENKLDISDLEFIKSGQLTEEQATELYWKLEEEFSHGQEKI